MSPGGIRIGTPAITSRGMVEKDMIQVADFLMGCVDISLKAQKKGGKNMKGFMQALDENSSEIESLEKEIIEFSSQFIVPGFGDNL